MIDIYEEDTTLIGSIQEDITNPECFFDAGSSAEILSINGRKIPGVLTQSKHARRLDPEMLNESGLVLFLRKKEVARVKVNEILRVNSEVYAVKNVRLLGGSVWRIELMMCE